MSIRSLRAIGASNRGFTLLEILVSVTVLTIIAAFMFPVVDGASSLWRKNEQRVDSFREARAALQFISRELSGLLRHEASTVPQILIDPQSSALAMPSQAVPPASGGGSLFFLANISQDSQDPQKNFSNVCSIGYYLAFTPDRTAFNPSGTSEGSCKVYRYAQSSVDTFAAITSSGPLFSGVDPGVADKNEILARNISRFQVKGLRWNSATKSMIADSPWPQDQRPDAIEITMTALNSGSAARMTTRQQWISQSDPLFAQEAQTFVVRIDVKK